MTLQETADALGGLSRERVRQLQAEALRNLQAQLDRLVPALDVVETASTETLPLGSWEKTVDVVQATLRRGGWHEVHRAEVVRLVVAVRTLCDAHEQQVLRRWPRASYTMCTLRPQVRSHPRVCASLAGAATEQKEAIRAWTYEELAETALRDAGHPLHWKAILERAEALNKRISINTSGFFNALGRSKQKFVRVDHGTYGLAEWGLIPVRKYREIALSVLDSHGRSMTFADLRHHVNQERPVTDSSLRLMVDTHPDFYRSVEGSYGCRTWLPPREWQTLRTPPWLVEPIDSYRRILPK